MASRDCHPEPANFAGEGSAFLWRRTPLQKTSNHEENSSRKEKTDWYPEGRLP
jgi:hypothetical protein